MYTFLVLLHVLGAVVWAGGHIALAAAVLPKALSTRETGALRSFERGFALIGHPALLVQVVTGLWLMYTRFPDISLWVDMKNPQVHLLMTKLMLLLATLVLVIHARVRIWPRLDQKLGLYAGHTIALTVLSILFVLTGVLFRTGGIG